MAGAVNSDTRRLRKSPDTKNGPYPELCKRGIYNVIRMVMILKAQLQVGKHQGWICKCDVN